MGLKFKYKALSDVGRVRKANEDCFGELLASESNGNGSLFIVCDGMGGHVGGAVASQTAVNSIKDFFRKEYYPDPSKAVEQSILFANQKVYQLSQERSDLKGMGTTCVVLLQRDNEIYIAHVGDSRIYLHTKKQIHRLTKDHSYVQSLVDMGEIVEMDGLSIDEQMEKHPRSNELSRAIGIRRDVNVEVCPTPIYALSGDTFLLCTDGLTGLVNDRTISNTLNNNIDNNKIANALISMANNAGGKDNITVSLITITDSPHRNPQFIDKSNQSNFISGTQEHFIDIKSSKFDNFTNKISYYFNKRKVLILGLLLIVCCVVFGWMYFKPGANPPLPPTGSGGTDVDLTDTINGQEPQALKTIEDEIKEEKAKKAAERAAKDEEIKRLQKIKIDEFEEESKNWSKDWVKLEYSKDKQGYSKEIARWKKDCRKNKKCNRWTNKEGKELVFTKAKVIYHKKNLKNKIFPKGAGNIPLKSDSVQNLLDKQEIEALKDRDEFIEKWKAKGYKACIKKEDPEFYNKLKELDRNPENQKFKMSMEKRTSNSYSGTKVIMYKCEKDTLIGNNKRLCENWLDDNNK